MGPEALTTWPMQGTRPPCDVRSPLEVFQDNYLWLQIYSVIIWCSSDIYGTVMPCWYDSICNLSIGNYMYYRDAIHDFYNPSSSRCY